MRRFLKEIAKDIDLDFNLTTYTWRHTFATTLKNEMNVSIEEISELLGHADIKTTQIYLKKFPQEKLDEIISAL